MSGVPTGPVPGTGSVDELATRLRWVGEALTAAAGTVARVDPGAGAFGVGGPGELGDVGLLLYRRWAAALAARSAEASAHGTRLLDAAGTLAETIDRYRAADADADGTIRASWTPR